jgi:predicted ester cyclase
VTLHEGPLRSLTVQLYEALSARNLDSVRGLLHSDFVDRTAVEHTADQEGFLSAVATTYTAFPDLELIVQDMFVASDENKVAVRALISGTHSGKAFGVQPTYRTFGATSIDSSL